MLATIACHIRGAGDRCLDLTTFSLNWKPAETTSFLNFSSREGD
jgi:hypothetical protein